MIQAATFACWCGWQNGQQQYRTSVYGLVRCGSCGCYRIDPPPISRDDQAPGFYTGYYSRRKPTSRKSETNRSSRFWHVVRREPSLDGFGQRAVDVGCGEGHLCHELRLAGWPRVIGLDVSRARIERARRSYPDGEFYDRPIDETDMSPASLDLIVMDNVIEHLPDPLETLRTLRRYLKPQGRLVVITPNMKSGNFRLLGRRWTPELAPHAHVYLFTPRSMSVLLANAGFTVDSVSSFHLSVYSFAAWTGRLMSPDFKGAIWRAMQELGGIYGRLIGVGPMLYAVARPSPSADLLAA